MGSTTQTEHVKASRKAHGCSWCAERINVGESYKRYRCFDYGDAATVKMHPECFNAMQAEAAAEGGWFEFVPGDQERPKP